MRWVDGCVNTNFLCRPARLCMEILVKGITEKACKCVTFNRFRQGVNEERQEKV